MDAIAVSKKEIGAQSGWYCQEHKLINLSNLHNAQCAFLTQYSLNYLNITLLLINKHCKKKSDVTKQESKV